MQRGRNNTNVKQAIQKLYNSVNSAEHLQVILFSDQRTAPFPWWHICLPNELRPTTTKNYQVQGNSALQPDRLGKVQLKGFQ